MNVVVDKKYVCFNSDLCQIGKSLGMEWNYVCDLLMDNNIHGSDGSGFIIIHGINEDDPQNLKDIMTELLKQSEGNPVYILDDF